MNLYFTYQDCGTLKSCTFFIAVKTIIELSLGQCLIKSFHVVVLQAAVKKNTYIKKNNTRVQPLFFC